MQVDVHYLVPVRGFILVHQGRYGVGDTRVVEENIDAAEHALGLFERLGDLPFVRDVAPHGKGLPAQLADFGCGGLGSFHVDVSADDVRTRLSTRFGELDS